MNYYLKCFIGAVFGMILISCGSKPKALQHATKTYTILEQPFHKTMHFTGTIKPLKESVLTAPMEAVVESMEVHYGQMVKKGDVVFTLNSTDLQREYNETLTDYLKAKDSYSIAKAKFSGTQELWSSGLIPKNNYLSERSSLDTARVALIQSTRKLTALLDKMEDKTSQDVSSLSLADVAKVRKALSSSHNIIQLKAPYDGVLLYPPKTSQDKLMRVSVGAAVKSGQVLALVGDLKGVSVEIDVPEIDIDAIQTGMSATITGVAFGGKKLKGTLVAVNAQALSVSNGGLPSFTALVEVPRLSKAQKPWIKVGMSATIEINAEDSKQLLIPIAAVLREKGNSMVHVQLKDGKSASKIITTGPAQAEFVVVASGLKVGDVVTYD
jgi:HlyD family secretion protein